SGFLVFSPAPPRRWCRRCSIRWCHPPRAGQRGWWIRVLVVVVEVVRSVVVLAVPLSSLIVVAPCCRSGRCSQSSLRRVVALVCVAARSLRARQVGVVQRDAQC